MREPEVRPTLTGSLPSANMRRILRNTDAPTQNKMDPEVPLPCLYNMGTTHCTPIFKPFRKWYKLPTVALNLVYPVLRPLLPSLFHPRLKMVSPNPHFSLAEGPRHVCRGAEEAAAGEGPGCSDRAAVARGAPGQWGHPAPTDTLAQTFSHTRRTSPRLPAGLGTQAG